MRIVPYLNFGGQAEEALHFYASALGGKASDIMRFGDNPFPGMPEEMKNFVMHTELHFDDFYFYLSDTFDPENINRGNAHTMHIDCDSEDQLRSFFGALREGATTVKEPEDTFWGAIYGDLVDKFGVQWSFNYQKPE